MENRKPNYWEDVEPEEVDTGKNVFRFYPEAERLQVSMPDFKKADGVWRHVPHRELAVIAACWYWLKSEVSPSNWSVATGGVDASSTTR